MKNERSEQQSARKPFVKPEAKLIAIEMTDVIAASGTPIPPVLTPIIDAGSDTEEDYTTYSGFGDPLQ